MEDRKAEISEKIKDYPTAARSIALKLDKYCDKDVAMKAKVLEAENKKLKEKNQQQLDEMQDLLFLANIAFGFVAITPEHKLYDSIRQDMVDILAKLKGGE